MTDRQKASEVVSGQPKADDRPLVTFALFTYNQQEFVERAVESVFNQTHEPLEIILSDDCSSDRTFERMQVMVAEYDGPHQVTLRRNEKNLGLCGHIQKVSELARGRFIIVAAGDDISVPSRSSRIMEVFSRSPDVHLVYSEVSSFENLDRTESNCGSEQLFRSQEKIFSINAFFADKPIPVRGAAAAYTVDVFRSFAAIPRDAIYEDSILMFRALLLGPIKMIHEPLVHYRIHDTQTTNINTRSPRDNLRKRLILIAGANAVASCQLSDYISIHGDHVKYFFRRDFLILLARRALYYARVKSVTWIWPARIVPYLLLFLFKGRIKERLGLHELALSFLPRPIYLLWLNFRLQRR